ncbi:unnamed protein product [Oppiella nova]|uniref:ABC-2 type transporter transmembrane domain-containing protein n=1 Tax=Oppiella nova TaxID=334625 RepID=A0A7R9M3A5_9ACAR|nr:unnamed protein product [Oppiella nova]CAG2169951.1 unnamed protein product [Oppiella nova]
MRDDIIAESVLGVVSDVRLESDCRRLIDTTIDSFGRLDILVNSTGVFDMTGITDPGYMQKQSQVFDVNLNSVILLTHLSVKYLETTKGNIIYISIQVLKTMASEGRTVICTIHQPSSPVFQLFDSLLLMADGRVAFMGSIGEAKDFFSSQGLEICDYYLEWNANTVNSRYNVDNMCALNLATLGSGYRASYWQQLVTCMAVLFGVLYYGQGYDYSNVDNIKGALNLILMENSMTLSMIAMTTLIGEEALLCREHHNRTYALFPYMLATIITQVQFNTPTLVNRLTNCTPLGCTKTKFYLFNKVGWLDWLQYLAFPYYGYQSLVVNEWRNVGNMSSDITNTTQSTTTYTSGVEVIESMGFKELSLQWCPIALMAWTLVYMCIAYIGLCRKVRHQ